MLNKKLIDWDDATVEKLKRLWKSGDNAAEIAAKLGCENGRLAVIGKAKRLKLGPHPFTVSKAKASANKSKRSLRKIVKTLEREGSLSCAKISGPVRKRKPPRPAVVIEKVVERRASIDGPSMKADYRFQQSKAWMALEGSQPVPLVDLKKGQCLWPLGDGPFLFCALPKHDSRYCATHAHLSNPRT